MRHLRNALAAAPLLFGACAPMALVAPALAQTCACAPEGGATGAAAGGYVIQADEPPPPLPEYDQPPIPAPGYYWTPGYWAWNNYDYYWVPGAWVEPPQPGLLWTPGYWAFVGGVYAFRPGYWGPRVGFYGGVDYGYGYAGSGYQGGRWDNGRFFYNTTVNNVAGAHITNVYNQPIARNATINRASFNGGAGGVTARPTTEELQAAKEARVQPTKQQINQARAAGMRSEQFVSTNRGKPAVAATEHAGEFKGKGVIPAKAAGKAALAAPTAPAPARNVLPENREKPPTAGKPVAPGLAPNAPATAGKPPAAEKLGKPEAAPAPAKPEAKPPAAEKMAKPEAAPSPPKIEEKRPAAGKPARLEPPKVEQRRPAEQPMRAAPPNAPQRALERPPAQVPRPPVQLERRAAQPERRPEACGRPGLPPCPK